MGSVSPLIAVWQKLKEKDSKIEVLFVGTKNGPEREFVGRYQLPYQAISAGKLRRYFSLWNIFDVLKIILAIFQSFNLLRKFKPDIIISAGSFVGVPLIWASKFFKCQVLLYQPDLKAGLANKLCQNIATGIFTAFPETVKNFPPNKAEYLGSLFRNEILQVLPQPANHQPTILVLGGGTGSAFINQIIKQALPKLLKHYRIIHVSGREKNNEFRIMNYESGKYQVFEILKDNYYQMMAEADLVVSRAGLSTLMELSYLGKPAILIPLPNSAQEQNAQYFQQKNAALIFSQKGLMPDKLINEIDLLMNNREKLSGLSDNVKKIFRHGSEKAIIDKIISLYEF